MSSVDKEMKSQYLAHQISFLKEAKLGWTSAVESYTNQVVSELDAWLNDPSSSKTFTDMTNLAHRAVILLTERSQEIQNLSNLIDSPDVKNKENCHITSRPVRSNNHDIKNIQSRLESVENVISSLRATTKLLRDKQKKIDGWAQKSSRKISTHQNFVKNRAKKFFIQLKHIQKQSLDNESTLNKLAESVAALEEKQTSDGTMQHESNISESEFNSMKEIFNNQNKITDDLKENFNSCFHKLSSDIRTLDENYQKLSAHYKNEMENLQEIISSIKNNKHSSKLEDIKNYKEMELKYGMLCQMLLKKVSSVEKFQVAMNQKLGQTAICPNQQKLDQVSCDLESATKALTDLKHAFDTLSARIDSWPPPQPPPQFMPPPPPHPFHHDHHHRRHHHRHC